MRQNTNLDLLLTHFNHGSIYSPSYSLGHYTASQIVFVWSDSQAIKDKEFPCNVAGILIVNSGYTNDSYIYVHQVYITRDNNQYWARMYDHNTDQWSEWSQIILQK